MNNAPFDVGERLNADQLLSWNYKGLTGKPGIDTHAVRRFTKGCWVLEVEANKNPSASTRVVSIRTEDQDDTHWRQTRRHRVA